MEKDKILHPNIKNMELSAIALKTLISFSLGLSANTAQNPSFGDTLKVTKTTQIVNAKSKQVKQNKLKPNEFVPKKESKAEELNSCGKCGKG